MTSSDALVGLSLAIAIAIATPVVASAAASETSNADVDEARALLRKGNELRAAGNLPGALGSYEAAHALVRTPITGLEVGRTRMLLGQLLGARDAFREVASMPRKTNESANAAGARAEAARLATVVEERLPRVAITIVGGSDSAIVELDGRVVGKEERAAVAVDPGAHRVVVRDGVVTRKAAFEIAERETKTLRLELPTSRATATGSPPLGASTPPSTATEPRDEPRATSRASALTWVGFGVAGTGLLVGAVTGVMTFAKASDLQAACHGNVCPPDHDEELRSAKALGLVSDISFGVAAIGVAVGVYGLVRGGVETPARVETAGVRVKPWIGLGALGIEGSF